MTAKNLAEATAALAALGHDVSNAATVHGAYRPAVWSRGMVFTSGQIPVVDGAALAVGYVGADVTAERAAQVAGVCAASAIRAAFAALPEADRALSPVKLTVFVAAAPGFTALPAVANGASEVIAAVFDEVPARSAVGVAELPLGVPVEVEAVFTEPEL